MRRRDDLTWEGVYLSQALDYIRWEKGIFIGQVDTSRWAARNSVTDEVEFFSSFLEAFMWAIEQIEAKP